MTGADDADESTGRDDDLATTGRDDNPATTGRDDDPATVGDLAGVVRSKNAGPFRLTIDVFFDSEAAYRRVASTGAISRETVAEAYRIDESAVLGVYELDRLSAVKVSIERPIPAGSVADSDVYGAQQHRPLVRLELPAEPPEGER